MALQLKKQTLADFIRMYRTLPCMWDTHHAHYKNKKKRMEATNKLLQLVKQDDPEATRLLVVKKIDMLRSGVRRELAKVLKSRENNDPNDEYVPSLWYYKMFSFLYKGIGDGHSGDHSEDDEKPKNSILRKFLMTNEEDEDLSVHMQEDEQDEGQNEDNHGPFLEQEPEYFENSYDDVETKVETIESGSEEEIVNDVNETYSRIVEKTRKRKRSLEFENHAPSSTKKLREIADEFDAIGINVAAKLRSLPPNTSILAEKLINDALFQAQLNLLTPYTSLVHKNPL